MDEQEHKGNGAGTPHKLTPEEGAVVADIDRSIGRMKIDLASLVVQIETLNAQKMAIVQRVASQEEAMRTKLNEFMQAHGLDPSRSWHFDVPSMTFSERQA